MLYSLAIRVYSVLIQIASWFNPKAKLLVDGRKQTAVILSRFTRDPQKKLAWFHCASLGEFEQARPVIEALKQRNDVQIAVSFFSPSGYEIRKNYEHADVVFYLPSDTTAHAKWLIDKLSPTWVVVVKYEIWLRLLAQLNKLAIPTFLLSATFRENQIYFKWYGTAFKQALKGFQKIFTQDHQSTKLLQRAGFTNVEFSNDTRYDRVFETCKHPKQLDLVKAFKNEHTVLVLGSSYAPEEALAAAYLSTTNDNIKVIVAPHQITPTRLDEVEKTFDAFPVLRYSEASLFNAHKARVLLIDNIGLLSSIYQYADVALIGGGFAHKGIHNTLEAATFGMPIFIGPNNHDKFPEIALLKQAGVLKTVHAKDDFMVELMAFTTNMHLLQTIKKHSRQFIADNTGATQVVLKYFS